MGCVCVVACKERAIAPLQTLTPPEELGQSRSTDSDEDIEEEYFTDDGSASTTSTQDPSNFSFVAQDHIANLSFCSQMLERTSSSVSSPEAKYKVSSPTHPSPSRVRVYGRRVVASREPHQRGDSHHRPHHRAGASPNPPRHISQLYGLEGMADPRRPSRDLGLGLALGRVVPDSPAAAARRDSKVTLHFKVRTPRGH
eukprot:EG_transcript_9989